MAEARLLSTEAELSSLAEAITCPEVNLMKS